MSPIETPPAESQGHRPRVSVVVPNYNGIQHLPECLECLFSQTFDDFEIVMVDNASTDDSVAWVRDHYPTVRIVQRAVNGGPVKSTNDGIRASRGDYIAILDNDTAFGPDWLGILVTALDEHPGYDSAVSMVLLYDETDLVQTAGELYSVRLLCNVNRGFGRPAAEYSEMRRVLATQGNGVIHRREVFDDVGLYDEDYHALFEDTDFSLRCLIRDKRCLYVPGARVRHKIGLSRETGVSHQAQITFARNGTMMAAKTLPTPLLAIGLLSVLWRAFRSTFPLRPRYYPSIPDLVRNSSKHGKARWEGLRMGWAKRGPIWRARTNSRREIYRWLLRGEGPV